MKQRFRCFKSSFRQVARQWTSFFEFSFFLTMPFCLYRSGRLLDSSGPPLLVPVFAQHIGFLKISASPQSLSRVTTGPSNSILIFRLHQIEHLVPHLPHEPDPSLRLREEGDLHSPILPFLVLTWSMIFLRFYCCLDL